MKVWDAHRPLAVQQQMWDAIQDPRYVSDPSVNAGRHTRGASVDVTLINQRGNPLRMPTDYDDFSKSAHVDAEGVLAVEGCVRAERLAEVAELLPEDVDLVGARSHGVRQGWTANRRGAKGEGRRVPGVGGGCFKGCKRGRQASMRVRTL